MAVFQRGETVHFFTRGNGGCVIITEYVVRFCDYHVLKLASVDGAFQADFPAHEGWTGLIAADKTEGPNGLIYRRGIFRELTRESAEALALAESKSIIEHRLKQSKDYVRFNRRASSWSLEQARRDVERYSNEAPSLFWMP